MSNIVIDDNYTLKHDQYSWQLTFRHEGEINPKTGKPKVTHFDRWYPNIQMSLEAYIDSALKESTDIKGILTKLDEVKKIIKKIYELRAAK